MKKLFLAMIFGIILSFVHAALFGLKMGMTVEEIAEQCEEEPSYVKDEYWFQTLKDGSRQLSAVWGEKTELADGLVSVALDCVADNDIYHYEDAHLVLYYYFKNAASVEDEQDEVF
ncbi:hypothetical protein [Treponema pedis]|uniref:hypothetical protein n=1 Tax=Treponema pedis TaxID=409322 RepID=UPI00040AEA5E|nr:hypothetical protein [Treponema pedis]